MIAKKFISICAIVSVFYMASCLKDDFVEVDGVCPVVLSTTPANGAINVPFDQSISVNFNEEMNPATITSASLLITGTTTIDGVITYHGTTATFTPTSPLAENTSYTGRVTTKVKDKTGNALQTDYVWTFTTGDILNPLIIFTDPANLEGNVNLNKIITATFNMPMDESSINPNTFALKLGNVAIPGSISYIGTTASFFPTNDLQPNTTYTAVITTGIKNPAGLSLSTGYEWTFTTGTSLAPNVVSTDPTNNAVEVALNKVVSATFSEVMNPSTINNASFTIRQGATVVAGTVTYTGLKATFIASEPLLPATIYTGTISKSVRNSYGTSITSDYIWTFTTVSGTTPTVTSTDPANNEMNVPINKTISAIFSEVMDPSSINNSSFVVKQGATIIAGSISYSGKTAYFKPSNNLPLGTTFTAAISTGAKNVDGTSLANNYTWSFTTGSALAPTVISTDPANNETNVALGKNISAKFSVPMNPSTLNASTFTLKSGSTLISGNVTYSGSTVTFDPSVNLLPGLNYSASISQGATDLSGTHMASSYSWTFSTGAAIAPTIIFTDPLNSAIGVSLSKTLTASFSVPMDPLTINNSTFTLKNGNTLISGSVSYSGLTAAFNPTINLLPGATFTATITNGAKNLAGTPLFQDYVWTFTTVSAAPPTIISTDPANNESGVGVNNTIKASFSEVMDASTINNSTFILKNGNTVVNGNVSLSGLTVLFIPSGNLLANTVYTAKITTGVKSAAGVSLASDFIWTFTTALPPEVPLIDLGTSARFGIVAGTGVSNNSGISQIINLDVGISPGGRSSILGFPPAILINGSIFASDDATPSGVAAMLTLAKQDLTAAFNLAAELTIPAPVNLSGDQGGHTLTPGIYKCASPLSIVNGNLTLDAQGNSNAVWIFQIESTLTTGGGVGGNIILSGGAKASNIFWIVGNTATIGSATNFKGNILAKSAITLNTLAAVQGRLLCIDGAVVLKGINIITKP